MPEDVVTVVPASPHAATPAGAAAGLLRVLVCGDDAKGRHALLAALGRSPQGLADGGGLSMPAGPVPIPDGPAGLPRRAFTVAGCQFLSFDTSALEKHALAAPAAIPLADVALLLADVRPGGASQLRRQAGLLALCGIRHVVLAVDNMETVHFAAAPFRSAEQAFAALAAALPFLTRRCLPVAALDGDNIVRRSSRMPWYAGPALLEYLESAAFPDDPEARFVFPVLHVAAGGCAAHGLLGTVASGRIARGEPVRMNASGQVARVRHLLSSSGAEMAEAAAGHAVTLVLDSAAKVGPDEVLTCADQPLTLSDQFAASIVWLHADAGLVGRRYAFRLANQRGEAALTSLKYGILADTEARAPCRQLACDDIALANLTLDRPVLFDAGENAPALGGFLLQDRCSQALVAVGFIRHDLRRAQNVHRQVLSVSRAQRERIKGQQGKVVWFTGLSGSGKSTLANALESALHARGCHTYLLDGDNVRQGLNKDLGFSAAERVENIRRVAEVARLMLDAGLIVMTAFISPFRAEREMARQLIGQENFIEVYLDTPLEICEQRDAKGLYKKARSGLLPNMTGIDSPYEVPEQPGMVIDGRHMSVDDAVACLLRLLGDSS